MKGVLPQSHKDTKKDSDWIRRCRRFSQIHLKPGPDFPHLRKSATSADRLLCVFVVNCFIRRRTDLRLLGRDLTFYTLMEQQADAALRAAREFHALTKDFEHKD